MSKSKYTIIVDPGHGGRDSGALGPRGTRESDVALAVCLHLATLLQAAGQHVVMTRTDDSYVSLGDRCRIANEADGDLFLSVHANSAERPAKGIETFVCPTAGPKFGDSIQRALMAGFPGRTDRGLKRAGYHVLLNTRMSAALAEIEFLHTQEGEMFLTDLGCQIGIAKALCNGILSYLDIIPQSSPPPLAEPVPHAPLSLKDEIYHVIDHLQKLTAKL